MKRIDTILWDVDGTLLDFEAAEAVCLRSCIRLQGIPDITEAQLRRYNQINKGYWQALERGEVTKDVLYPGRFRDWFDEMGFSGLDPVRMNDDYQEALGRTPIPQPGMMETLERLQALGYRQYVVTNGSTIAQQGKLNGAGIERFISAFFISEEMGIPKPHKEYFDMCAAAIPDYDPDRTVIIGDSLTSDIAGGINAGISTVWFDPFDRTADPSLRIDARVRCLQEIPDILERL